VRGDGFGRKGWASGFGCGGVFAKDVPHTEKRVTGEPLALRKSCWAAGSFAVRCWR
jgi:hypothetical protein